MTSHDRATRYLLFDEDSIRAKKGCIRGMNVVSLIIGACSLHRDKWRVAVHECVLCLASVCVNWICVKAFDQCEYLSMVSDGTLDEMPMKQRKKFTGTNQGKNREPQVASA